MRRHPAWCNNRCVDALVQLSSAVATCFTSLLFLRALLHKLRRPGELVETIRGYRLLPERIAAAVSVAVVAGEAFVAIGLLTLPLREAAALLACILLLSYAAAIGINLLRGRTGIHCGCGTVGQGISIWHVLRNVVLAAGSLLAMTAPRLGPIGLERLAVVAGCTLVAWFTFLAFDQLLGNRTHSVATEYSPF
jgi:hypothetical protein